MYLTYFLFIINLNICIILLRDFFFFLKFVADFCFFWFVFKKCSYCPFFLSLLMAA